MYRKSHLPNMRILEEVILSELTREEISELKPDEMIGVIQTVSENYLGAIEYIRKQRSKKETTVNNI